ncbi:flavin monoamine oxidase family protein [Deinococcus lacus]|uniref:Flavin monoamine oxidase family protein n=1 Tax=Deinococcus lacus TaxID=392561 RepID=A0ABW1YEY6_9DEIO
MKTALSRRRFIEMMGAVGGSAAAYYAMTSLGFAQASVNAVPALQGSGAGKSVLILGAGLAGMSSAYEMKKAGYDVKILEFNSRAGGRCWTLRGGDTFTELGGETQRVTFQDGNYLNPGPWRIPYHHHTYMHYAREFGVKLEPFIQVNENAYIHRAGPGKKYRIREVRSDFYGNVAELLSKATNSGALDSEFTGDDRDIMTEALSQWGALDESAKYVKGLLSSSHRGYAVDPGDRLDPGPGVPSDLIPRSELLAGGYWQNIVDGLLYEHQQAIFQPVGGMDMMARAFEQRTRDMITYQARVTGITVTDTGVSATYQDAGGAERQVEADYCICTIPLSVLSQLDLKADAELVRATREIAYAGSFKAGLEANRFWETEEHIYGGVTYTDLPIAVTSYPSTGQNLAKTGVVLAAYQFGPDAIRFSGMSPEARLAEVRGQYAQIHPQMEKEFISGASVGWHRVPWSLGCYAPYTDEQRKTAYVTLSKRHGPFILAGEHISYWNGWQEGALLSAMSAVQEIHAAAQAS